MTTYSNPWHKPHDPIYGPAYYSTDARSISYKGFLIYQRISGVVWDVVKDGACVTQRAGISGARRYIDGVMDGLSNPSER